MPIVYQMRSTGGISDTIRSRRFRCTWIMQGVKRNWWFLCYEHRPPVNSLTRLCADPVWYFLQGNKISRLLLVSARVIVSLRWYSSTDPELKIGLPSDSWYTAGIRAAVLQKQAVFYFRWTAYFAFIGNPSYCLVFDWRKSRGTSRPIHMNEPKYVWTNDRDCVLSLIVLQSYVGILLIVHHLVCKGQFRIWNAPLYSTV